jgi:hypothetical protein
MPDEVRMTSAREKDHSDGDGWSHAEPDAEPDAEGVAPQAIAGASVAVSVAQY